MSGYGGKSERGRPLGSQRSSFILVVRCFTRPCHQSHLSLAADFPRCHGATDDQTKSQICPRPMALHPSSRRLQVSMASRASFTLVLASELTSFAHSPCNLVHDHLCPRRPLRFSAHPPGWRLDSSPWRTSRGRTISCCRSHLGCDERLREGRPNRPWRLCRN